MSQYLSQVDDGQRADLIALTRMLRRRELAEASPEQITSPVWPPPSPSEACETTRDVVCPYDAEATESLEITPPKGMKIPKCSPVCMWVPLAPCEVRDFFEDTKLIAFQSMQGILLVTREKAELT